MRTSQRIPVSLKMSCGKAAGGSLRILDMSLGGLLLQGRIAIAEGAPLEGTVHVLPYGGDMDVTISGTAARVMPDGEDSVVGVKIDSFDSEEGKKAYEDFVGELYADS